LSHMSNFSISIISLVPYPRMYDIRIIIINYTH